MSSVRIFSWCFALFFMKRSHPVFAGVTIEINYGVGAENTLSLNVSQCQNRGPRLDPPTMTLEPDCVMLFEDEQCKDIYSNVPGNRVTMIYGHGHNQSLVDLCDSEVISAPTTKTTTPTTTTTKTLGQRIRNAVVNGVTAPFSLVRYFVIGQINRAMVQADRNLERLEKLRNLTIGAVKFPLGRPTRRSRETRIKKLS